MKPVLVLAGAATAAASWRPQRKLFDNLVTFGDSYTDDGRLGYYVSHDGKPPPAGTLPDVTNRTASGGLAWGQFVAQYTGAGYYDYAISGATCSNAIVSRLFAATGKPFPSVLDDEIPSFEADVAAAGGGPYARRRADNTVFALWIGTNDLGVGGFLTDSQAPGTNLTSYADCVWAVLDRVHAAGGRRIVLLNNAPLHLAPLYASQGAHGGAGDSQYWANKTLYNETEYEQKALEYAAAANRALEHGAPFHLLVRRRWPGLRLALFDVHRLLTDVHRDPGRYLDAPADGAGFYHRCRPANTSDCADSPLPPSSFLWYDELHPSEKTDSVIAKHFIDVVAGNSSYGVEYGR